MANASETTTLICLFHHHDLAQAALKDLLDAGVSSSSITTIGHDHSQEDRTSALAGLGIPERDLGHLHDGLREGGTILAVSAVTDHVETVERIFGEHKAKKIDEVGPTEENFAAAAPLAASGETVLPVVEEELVVGKRTVDQGGVRVYRRVVEMPAEATVNLREEHVTIERNPVDRVATAADLRTGDRVIELTETAEEAVVGKSARVVEEVYIGKQVGEHTETISDTVRKTVVDMEEIPASETVTRTTKPY